MFFFKKFTTISGNNWKQNKRKLTDYLIFMMKNKYIYKENKESKIVKKCLGCINLLVVSRGKCNNDMKKENST